ncbi:MAG: iron complex outermembrane receptor protein [Arenicella sp.]|jgi:iron complex outermembrane receptor protein
MQHRRPIHNCLALLILPSLPIFADSQIEEVLVLGRAQEFYLERSTTVGSKLDLDIMDLPQSAQILNDQLIKDQAARDITDLYRSIAGVSEFSYSGVTFRGFRDSGNVFYDGVRGDPYSGFGVPQLFNVERVEVLKGPAAALYGGGEPGGMINYVTRKPSFERQTSATITVGDYDLIGGSVDTQGAVSDTLAYRVGAFYEEQDSFRNNADERNIELAGGLLYQPTDLTALTISFDYVDQDLGGNRLRGVPVDDNGNFLVDPSYNANEKVDYQTLTAKVLQAHLAHRFNDKLSIDTTLRYLKNDRDQGYHESREWVDVNGDGIADINDETIRREYRLQSRGNEEISFTSDVVYKFRTGGVEHQFLVGGDYHDTHSEYDYSFARYEAQGVGNLNIFNLNYGESDPSNYDLIEIPVDGGKSERYGLYAQDYITLNQEWAVLVGLRYDHFEDLNKSSGYDFSDSNVSPRFGVVYKPHENSSIYLNYSDSFKPTSLGDQENVEDDSPLDPEVGTQIELGIKSQWLDGSIGTTLAAYQIVKTDVALSNPNDQGPGDGIPDLLNLGEVESKGAEFTLVGDVATGWTVTANYAYNDTVVVKGTDDDSIRNSIGDGTRFANAPRHQAGLWTRYDFDSINSAIAFGVDYVGEQISFNEQRVKPFTVYDLSWSSYWESTELQFNIRNLFDKEYAVSGFNRRNGHFPGAPRELVMQITHNF